MDLEARSLQPSLKAALLAKLREYKSDLNKLKKEVKKLTSSGSDQAAHDALLEGEMADAHAVCAKVALCFGFLLQSYKCIFDAGDRSMCR